MSAAPLRLSPSSLHARFPDAFDARPAIYWADFLASVLVGWSAFWVAGQAGPGSPLLWLAGLVATLALYRAVLFIHELTHLKPGAVPRFEAVWNLLAGFPLMVPSLMYVGSHGDHHKAGIYGTLDDPEYDFIGRWGPVRLLGSTLLMVAIPALLILRWCVFTPLSYLIPPFRPLVVTHTSTLVINPRYRRRAPRGTAARRWVREEIGTALYGWAAIGALASGAVSLHWGVLWYAIGSGILLLNHVRTLAAHRYANGGDPMDGVGELLDSVNLVGSLTVLGAPVGLRYHALHHFAPSIPYHNLGRVHRALMRELDPGSPYRQAWAPGILSALAGMLRGANRSLPVLELEPRPAPVSGAPLFAADETAPATRTGTGAGADAR